MLNQREKFLRILRVEMEDLEDHILHLVEDYRERERRHEVTEHVCLGNLAVLGNEECALRHIRRILDETRSDDYPSLDGMERGLIERFEREIAASGLAHAALHFVRRKMERVDGYVRHAQEPAQVLGAVSR